MAVAVALVYSELLTFMNCAEDFASVRVVNRACNTWEATDHLMDCAFHDLDYPEGELRAWFLRVQQHLVLTWFCDAVAREPLPAP